ncbi:DNA polymerase III delta subunit [Mesomycoplasma flocculare]|uniref:DNA polymerase III subunit delta n=2 Tax=Mesomycoplasma flocculare TaxID=2128 RepID=A0A0A8E7C4_MESFC|nr:DNA polymerase III delta subunit [Mesomycoplasma flocculare]MXR39548.1 DNA polymerase III subunit delta' [Mycoplasma sp. MF12]AJC49889.1 DNA polymerase III subunit delta' [Mesomycoplasma flocculare ATCC 27399]ENX51224.1 DNA polymerase III delta subunit [Mesomycoplasma flocculare ATCC 27716]MXR12368.1 DNA polymerase III subunit delta' [Mesomycoplasma flocculare]MXR13601.1 DNA polymerase III subunit delta' [Mesomycoplasma flocculare]
MLIDKNNWTTFLNNLDKIEQAPHAILLISNYTNLLENKIKEFLNNFNHKYEIFLYDILDKNLSKQEFIQEVNKLYFSSFSNYQTKIFILKNIENAHISLLNAFLKILEDPPNSTYFLLTTKSQNLIISTVVSRCQVFWFNEFDQQKDIKKKLDKWKKSHYNLVYSKIFPNFEIAVNAIENVSDEDLKKLESFFHDLIKNKTKFLIFLNKTLTKENAFVFIKILLFYFKSIFLDNMKKNLNYSKKNKFPVLNFKKITNILQTAHKFLSSLNSNENFNVQKSAFLVRMNIILS